MHARVKPESPFNTITACGGLTFVKSEWRSVPAHEEASAKANPYLETADKAPAKAESKKLVVPAPKTAANSDKTVRLVNRRQPAADEPKEG